MARRGALRNMLRYGNLRIQPSGGKVAGGHYVWLIPKVSVNELAAEGADR